MEKEKEKEKQVEGPTPDLFSNAQFQKEMKERESTVAREIEQSWKHSSFNGVVLKNERMKLDVFVSSPVLIDHTVFGLWLEGYSAKDAAAKRKMSSSVPFEFAIFPDIILQDTRDQFRNFYLFEEHLQDPSQFHKQTLIQIEPQFFISMVEKYYAINPEIVRELAGKKLKSKLRNTLDDLSEKTRIPIGACRRQFDNLKRVYTFIIEKFREGKINNMTDSIQQHFLLSKELAEKYSRFIFLCYHRIETTDKRLKFLSALDLEYFANCLMTQWTIDDTHLELDRKFKEDIRDVRAYLLSDKVILDKYKSLVMDQMKQISIDEKIMTNFSYKFHVIVKALLHIGVGISKSSEFEDILEDLEEKLADTFFKLQLTESHVDSFFQALVHGFDPLLNTLSITRHRQRFSKTWNRFIEGIRQCVIQMYLVMEREAAKAKGPLTNSK